MIVLRITLPSCKEDRLFILEGTLTGEWVKEFIRVTNQVCPGKTSIFDIENVFYVDSPGEDALVWLNQLGATFIAENVYGRGLCERLHLHRTTAAKSGAPSLRKQRNGKSPTDLPRPSSPRRSRS
jgi:hypothetical protein